MLIFEERRWNWKMILLQPACTCLFTSCPHSSLLWTIAHTSPSLPLLPVASPLHLGPSICTHLFCLTFIALLSRAEIQLYCCHLQTSQTMEIPVWRHLSSSQWRHHQTRTGSDPIPGADPPPLSFHYCLPHIDWKPHQLYPSVVHAIFTFNYYYLTVKPVLI